MKHNVIIVMGVCGVGKTTIAQAIAEKFHGLYLEGDDFHPEKNIEAMRHGQPLSDEMRKPWLETLAHQMACLAREDVNLPVVAACSALKKSHRDILTSYITAAHSYEVMFVCLHADKELIAQRMQARPDHFMPISLLESQLAILEPPHHTEKHISVRASGTKQQTIDEVFSLLEAN